MSLHNLHYKHINSYYDLEKQRFLYQTSYLKLIKVFLCIFVKQISSHDSFHSGYYYFQVLIFIIFLIIIQDYLLNEFLSLNLYNLVLKSKHFLLYLPSYFLLIFGSYILHQIELLKHLTETCLQFLLHLQC